VSPERVAHLPRRRALKGPGSASHMRSAGGRHRGRTPAALPRPQPGSGRRRGGQRRKHRAELSVPLAGSKPSRRSPLPQPPPPFEWPTTSGPSRLPHRDPRTHGACCITTSRMCTRTPYPCEESDRAARQAAARRGHMCTSRGAEPKGSTTTRTPTRCRRRCSTGRRACAGPAVGAYAGAETATPAGRGAAVRTGRHRRGAGYRAIHERRSAGHGGHLRGGQREDAITRAAVNGKPQSPAAVRGSDGHLRGGHRTRALRSDGRGPGGDSPLAHRKSLATRRLARRGVEGGKTSYRAGLDF